MSRCWLCGFLLDSHNTSRVKENGCNRCFPDYDGGVVGVSLANINPTKKTTLKPSTSIRHSIENKKQFSKVSNKKHKKNVGVFSLDDDVDKDVYIHNRLRDFHLDNKDVKPMKSKIKGVRFY